MWTHELEFPELLSNDGDLFVKNTRFQLESVEPFLPANEEDIYKKVTKEYSELRGIKKHFFLVICPTRLRDVGWYSCTVVKKYINEPSVKYYTYLNVQSISNENSQTFDEQKTEDDFEEYDDYEQFCLEKKLIDETNFENNKSNFTFSYGTHKTDDDLKSMVFSFFLNLINLILIEK